eukprot:10894540-Alexandrium_andersonii.AAC.1
MQLGDLGSGTRGEERATGKQAPPHHPPPTKLSREEKAPPRENKKGAIPAHPTMPGLSLP